ncbi:hypothetical protein R3W88_012402 [Solanum pinnatisectum]|uniref:Uncharacterized protein n=1 Tax=Solanum pinnatisectum TaxID=50273 RepID=A0AAV9L970_9SOLN|nr:hypothetical protein R3W88_012402 [Solanum pinnatisectum]
MKQCKCSCSHEQEITCALEIAGSIRVGAAVRERWVSGGQVSWWTKGRCLTNFAGASLEQGRLSSIAIRGGFVRGASPEKMELR